MASEIKLSQIQQFTGSVIPAGSFVATVIYDNGSYVLRKVSPSLLGAQGPKGETGAQGATLRSGATAPAASLGNDGDYYINTATGGLYQKASGAWSLIGNVTGPKGDTGDKGDPGDPATVAGSDGYLQYNDGGTPAALAADAALQFDDVNSELYVNGNVRGGVETVAYAANIALDFLGKSTQIISVTGNIAFTSSNLAAGRGIKVVMTDDGSGNNLSFPAGWTFVGALGEPASMTAGKVGILSLLSTTGADAGVVAAYAEEP